MSIKGKKICLSLELERFFFREKLSKVELTRLKKICLNYQNFEPGIWSEASFRPYSMYFGFINALKTKAVFQEMWKFGYLQTVQSPLTLVDFGAGTLGASLGAYDFLKEHKLDVNTLHAVDSTTAGPQWAAKQFSGFLPQSVLVSDQISQIPANSIVIMANVWNEAILAPTLDKIQWDNPAWTRMAKMINESDPSQIFVFIEPASRAINQKFLQLRNHLSANAQILLPCTHQFTCPALAQNEWCHEEKNFKAPNDFWEIVRFLGFRQKVLSYSMLVVSKQESRFGETHARIVSSDVGGKGRCDKWLCSQGRRWKESRLTRHYNEENQAFYDGRRGSIIDCASTFAKDAD